MASSGQKLFVNGALKKVGLFHTFEWKLSYELIKLGRKGFVNCKWLQIQNLFIAKQMVGKSRFRKSTKLNINIQSSMVG